MTAETISSEKYAVLADDGTVERTAGALRANGVDVLIAASGADARRMVLELIPEKAEVMNMTSQTLDAIGLADDITASGRYESVRNWLTAADPETQDREKRRRGAAPDWAVGSVHAVTEDGRLMIASNTGSQLPAYLYGAGRVVWVISTKKIVKDTDDGMRRIREYVYPLEDQRSLKVYGIHSGISKVAVINREVARGRLTAVLVKETLGF